MKLRNSVMHGAWTGLVNLAQERMQKFDPGKIRPLKAVLIINLLFAVPHSADVDASLVVQPRLNFPIWIGT